MIEKAVQVPNRLGLHARAAAKFVHLANGFQARIIVRKDGASVDGKSILGLLTLAACKGTTLQLAVEGADEANAVEQLVDLVESGFGEGVA